MLAYGACSSALERLGIEHEIVDAVEIDKYAIKSFNQIHGTNFDTQDICTWDKDLEVDLIMHGSPCQDFSIAGLQAGGDIGSGTRSSLMYETVRIVGKLRPKYVIWENVKNVLSQKHKHNFDNYLNAMASLGYKNYYQVLNAKDYGIPQNRERVFTISIRNDINKEYIFPPKQELHLRLKDVLEEEVEERYYLSDTIIKGFTKHNENHEEKGTGFIWKPKEENDIASCLRANAALCHTDNTIKCKQVGELDIKGHDCVKRVYSGDGLSPTLTDMQGGNRQPKVIETYSPYVNKKYQEFIDENGYIPELFNPYNKTELNDLAPTLTAQGDSVTKSGTVLKVEEPKVINPLYDTDGITRAVKAGGGSGNIPKCLEKQNYRIRKLTPRECFRLMGFTDEEFDRASVGISNTQLYKMAGNSIVVNVLVEIFKNLFEVGDV